MQSAVIVQHGNWITAGSTNVPARHCENSGSIKRWMEQK